MKAAQWIASILLTISCAAVAIKNASAEEPITLMGTIVKWRYPDAEISKSEMSDAATTDTDGKRTVPSSLLKTTMKTDDSVEKVMAFYKELLNRTAEKDKAVGIGGQEGTSVIFGDETEGRELGFHTVLVNTRNKSTILIVSRADGESKTHITWKQYVRHEIGK